MNSGFECVSKGANGRGKYNDIGIGNAFADVVENYIGNAEPSCAGAGGGSVAVAGGFDAKTVSANCQGNR